MREALYRLIRGHYAEVLAVGPMALLLIGLFISVGIDAYIQKRQKRIMLVICALVFSLIASLILLGQLVRSALRNDRLSGRREGWIPVYSALILLLALGLDACVADTPQPVSFLTIAIVISSVLFYIWLHFRFVRAHENALAAEQRLQIMMTQIQPHFPYNTLATISGTTASCCRP